ncbi:hypothetical protein B0I35DRAFT_481461 [Stachybotrys elegans]|uniref:C2H2-type domain-containing protein n=1 Tax=Stachybotrys elegans TaxID=80388 RepID=A0A8K0WPR2_9HYPO|nr:hypothetical protein B0I35DRAFT_481461 [Stachybotrys elegans]
MQAEVGSYQGIEDKENPDFSDASRTGMDSNNTANETMDSLAFVGGAISEHVDLPTVSSVAPTLDLEGLKRPVQLKDSSHSIFPEMEPADYYKKLLKQQGITGSETDPSIIASSGDGQGTITSSLDSAEPEEALALHLTTDDVNIDRLAINLNKETISLLGRTDVMPLHSQFDGQDMELDPDSSSGKGLFTATSLEKDLCSEKDATEDILSDITEIQTLDKNHPFLKGRQRLLLRALRGFQMYIIQCHGQDSGAHHQELAEQNPSSSSSSSGAKRSVPPEAGSSNDRFSVAVNNVVKRRKLDGAGRTLACLYYKRNKMRHLRCLNLTLRRVKDVKQHLWRSHRQPNNYCATCYEIFTNQIQRDNHARERTCLERERPDWEGVSEDMRGALSQRVETGISEEAQWFSVWDLIFPNVKRPNTAYQEGQLEEHIDMLHDYWDESGQEVISSVLAQEGHLDWNLPGEERDLEVLHHSALTDLIGIVIRQFLMNSRLTARQSQQEAINAVAPSSSNTPRLPTPAWSRTSDNQATHDAAPAVGMSLPPSHALTNSTPGNEAPTQLPGENATDQSPDILNYSWHEAGNGQNVEQDFHTTMSSLGSDELSDLIGRYLRDEDLEENNNGNLR